MVDKYAHRYDDIINMPYHISAKHRQMPRQDRAAQFAAFAALTGYGDEIKETARLTDVRSDPDEEIKAELNRKLQILAERSSDKPSVTITYFVPDAKKRGGEYVTVKGNMKRLDEYRRLIIMTDKTAVPVDMITDIDAEVLGFYEESI